MGFKKRVVAVAAVVAMAAALLYGGTKEVAPLSEEESALSLFGEKETLYFWYADEALTNFVNSAAVSFGEKEDVRVIPVLCEESEYLEAINNASLHTNQIPDAYLLSHDSLEKAYLAGLAGEIKDVEDVANEEHFPKAALDAVTYDGGLVGYPLSFETSVLVYNETYLETWAAQQAESELAATEEEEEPAETVDESAQATSESADAASLDETAVAEKTEEYLAEAIPGTVDDILNIADTFDVPEGVEGVFEWDVSDIFYNYWLVGNYMIVGGDAGDDRTNINIDNEETRACLQVYKDLNQFFSIESDTVEYDAVMQDFIDGKIVFTIATTDAVATLEAAKEDGSLAYEYGFATVPNVSESYASRSMSVTNCVVINGYSEKKELANRFAAYLTGEAANSLYQMAGKVPANLNADSDNGALNIFKLEYAESIPLPKMMATGNYWIQLEALFANVWNDADVADAVSELAEQIASQVASEG